MRSIALAMAIVVVLGCAKSTAPTISAEVGVYTLQSVDAKALPATIISDGVVVEVSAGTLTLGAGNSLQISTTYRLPTAVTPQTSVVAGKYSMRGTSLSCTYSNGGTNGGVMNGSTVEMTNDNLLWSYRRM